MERDLKSFQEPHEIDPVKSCHCMAIQKSNYLVVETNINNFMKQYKKLKEAFGTEDFNHRIKCKGDINLRYGHEKDVMLKKFAFLKFKCEFLAKIKHMHENSKSINILM